VYIVVKQFDESALLGEQIEVSESVRSSMCFCFFDGGVGEDIDQYFSEFVLVIIVVWV
jgi:hypothetical protein